MILFWVAAVLLVSVHGQTCGYVRQSSCDSTIPHQNTFQACYDASTALDACQLTDYLNGTASGGKFTCSGSMFSVASANTSACTPNDPVINVTSSVSSQSVCGTACYGSVEIFRGTQNCANAQATEKLSAGLYTGGQCWNNQKRGCDANFLYIAEYDASEQCPTAPTKSATLFKYAANQCIRTNNDSIRFTGCTGTTTTLDFGAASAVRASVFENLACSGSPAVTFESVINQGTCDNQTMEKLYCDQSTWTYQYNDTTCTDAELYSVQYNAIGCVPSARLGSGFPGNSVNMQCLNSVTAPQFTMNGPIAQATQHGNPTCTSGELVGGIYRKVGVCAGGVKVTCTSSTAADVSWWDWRNPGASTCTGTPNSTVNVAAGSCVADPVPPSPGSTDPITYWKAVSCGNVSGTINPAQAPQRPLPGAGSRVGLASVVFVVGVVFSVFV